MSKLQETWIRERFPQLVGLMVVGGFALILAELLLMDHTEKTQKIGVLMTVVGMLGAGLGLVVGPRFRKALLGVLVLVAASGLFGTYEHLEEAQEHREKAAKRQQSTLVVRKADFDRSASLESEAGEHDKEEKEESGPPPLAPLGVSGLAVLGGLALMARKAA